MHTETVKIEEFDLTAIRYPIAPGAEVCLHWQMDPGIVWKLSRLELEPPEVLGLLEVRSLKVAHRECLKSPTQSTEQLQPLGGEWPVLQPFQTLEIVIFNRARCSVEVVCTPVGMMRRI